MKQTSKEYAIALFRVARETHTEDEILKGLRFVKEVFEMTPDYYAFLTSPSISKNERLKSIDKAFGADTAEYVVSFVCLLCEHKAIDLLNECIEEYEWLYNQSQNLMHAVVTSAVELTDDEKQRLTAKLERISGHKVETQYNINSALLGGLTVEMDGYYLDGSLKNRLKTIKEVMDE